MLSKILPIAFYWVLCVLNYYGFKKVQRLDDDWLDYEGNSITQWLMKRIGLEASLISTTLFVSLALLFVNFCDFLLGLLAGAFLFNIIVDATTIRDLLTKLEKRA